MDRWGQARAATTTHTRAVLAQTQVGGTPEEVLALQPLLAPLDPAGTVITADALQTHPEAAWVPGGQQARALPVGGQGQPADPAGPLHSPALAPRPELDRTRDRGHGRVELRTLKAVTVHHFGFPHAAQVIQVTRKTATSTTTLGGARP